MNANKTNSKQSTSSTRFVLTEEHLKLPEAKAFLKKVEELNKKKEIEEKLKPILELAGKTLGREFKKFSDLARYVGSKSENATRAKRLTEEQMKKIDEMKAQKKTHREIAAAVGCKEGQVNRHIYAQK